MPTMIWFFSECAACSILSALARLFFRAGNFALQIMTEISVRREVNIRMLLSIFFLGIIIIFISRG